MLTASQGIASAEKPTKQRMVLVSILLLTVTVAYFDRVNVSVLIANNKFLVDMGIKGQPVQIGLMMTIFLIAYGIGNVVLSPIGDYIGPRKAMSLAIALWAMSMVIGGLTSIFMIMLSSRLLLGIGEGMHFPMQSTFVKKWFPRQERARANAIWFIGTSFAPAIAMPIFAWIIGSLGWRISFWFCVVIGLLPLYLVWFHTTDTPAESKKVNALELAHIKAGLEKDNVLPGTAGQETIWEKVRLLAGNYRFWLLVVYYGVHNFVYWGLLTWLPTYLKAARGFSWAQMGVLASLPFILSIVMKLIGGWASDWVGRRAPFSVIATLGSAIGIYFTATVTNNNAAAALICFGMGILTLGAPMAFTMLQEMVPSRAISMGAGIMNGLSFCFASLGPLFIGYCISLTGGFAGALYVLVGMALVGTVSTLILAWQKY
jgi:sugar phosphate permease